MLLWSSSLSFVLVQVTPSQTTSFFCFVHTFPPPLLPSMCASFSRDLVFCTYQHIDILPLLLYLSRPFLYTPSMCLFINKSIHPLPGDRNESPARLSSIWWACYDCFCPHRPFSPSDFYLYLMRLSIAKGFPQYWILTAVRCVDSISGANVTVYMLATTTIALRFKDLQRPRG